jgi:hypothetical protein
MPILQVWQIANAHFLVVKHLNAPYNATEAPTAADSECQLLLVYADERVCARAKLPTFGGAAVGGGT